MFFARIVTLLTVASALVEAGPGPKCKKLGLKSCKGTCTDLKTDPMHCGRCRFKCPANSVCQLGSCVTCNSGLSICGNKCVDYLTDVNNCGECGKVCDAGNTCKSGACRDTTIPEPNPSCSGGFNCATGTVNFCTADESCVCVTTEFNGDKCVGVADVSKNCDLFPACTTTADCEIGECVLNTCCDTGVCVPLVTNCSNTASARIIFKQPKLKSGKNTPFSKGS